MTDALAIPAVLGVCALVGTATWLYDRHLKRTYERRQAEKKAARKQREAERELSEL